MELHINGQETSHGGVALSDINGRTVAIVYLDVVSTKWAPGKETLERPENAPSVALADFIVQAANAHDALVKAAKAALKYDESIAGRATRGEYDMAGSHAVGEGDDLDALYLDWITKSGAAIKLAKGE